MHNLACTTVQLDIIWQQPQANRDRIDELLDEHAAESDIVILPEMFSTGFSMDAEALAETMEGPTMQWMADLADRKDAVICGSIIIKESGNYYNRFVWMHPGGMYHTYDKRHLFKMAEEEKVYTRGEERVIINFQGWKISPMICYDLRFPVWSRNDVDYDLLIYVANWPEPRAHHWRTLLRARAIENQAYVIGVNRVGTDGKDHNYIGDTCIADPASDDLILHTTASNDVTTTVLSLEKLKAVREKLPFLVDQDEYKIL